MRVLHVDSSPKAEQSSSKHLGQFFVQRLTAMNPDVEVDYLDLSENPLPHIDGVFAKATYKPVTERDDTMVRRLQTSDALCARILDADCAVFGIPMHNWCYPSVFKAFIDHITRGGLTYRFDENGNVLGNLHGKKILFITTRGADLTSDPAFTDMDALTPALKAAFGFLGVGDMTFVDAQPLQFSNWEKHQLALEKARTELSSIAETW